jgi:hypothetical protein
MSNLIRRNALAEAIKQRMKLHEKDAEVLATKEAFYDDEELFLRLADECQAIIELVEEQKVEDEWISCSERLPKTNGVYSITRKIVDEEYIWHISDSAYFDGKNTWHADNRVNHGREYLKNVIAWMPLPEPYKGE